MNSIVDEIKDSFKRGGVLVQLIYINLAVFLVIKLLFVIIKLSGFENFTNDIIRFIGVPANAKVALMRPWTFFTYMFVHEKFLHILFNILWLYWLGKIFQNYFTDKQLLSTYILGGISGAILYLLLFNIIPYFEPYVISSIPLIGASASVMAIAIALAVYAPDYTIHLMFIGPVKLKWLAVVFVITDILRIETDNAGGHIAHLGGALFGYLYISQLRKGKDISKGFNRTMDSVASAFKPRKNMRVTYRSTSKAAQETDWDYNKRKATEQEQIDLILEKIAKSGYESLTKKEKEILFKASNKK